MENPESVTMEKSSTVPVGDEKSQSKSTLARHGSIVGSTVSFHKLSYFVNAPAPDKGCCRKAPKQILHDIRSIWLLYHLISHNY